MAVTASLNAAGVLTVTGSKKANQVDFRQSAGVISISGVNGCLVGGSSQFDRH